MYNWCLLQWPFETLKRVTNRAFRQMFKRVVSVRTELLYSNWLWEQKEELTCRNLSSVFILINSKLKKDMKMTNIEELQIQSETYYQEVMYSVLINHNVQPSL